MTELAELRANLAQYQEQMREIDEALAIDPRSQDHIDLRKELQEMVELTRELIDGLASQAPPAPPTQQQPPPPPPPPKTSAPPKAGSALAQLTAKQTVTELGGWKIGDKCRTIYLEDGRKYVAVVTGFRVEARSATVTFVGYLNQQETPLEYLERLPEEAVAAPLPGSSAAAPGAAAGAVGGAGGKKKGGVGDMPVILPTDTPEVRCC